MRMLDCFCGLGGVSDGFAAEGFEVLGIDVEDMPAKGYNHPFIQADIQELHGEDYRGYDVIWGSPPCRNFVSMSDWHWKEKKNPEKGLLVVQSFLHFVKAAKPKIWIMENVVGLSKFLFKKPTQVSWVGTPRKRRAFWGNYPAFLMPLAELDLKCEDIGKPYDNSIRMWVRSKIPLACSRAFAKACKMELTK